MQVTTFGEKILHEITKRIQFVLELTVNKCVWEKASKYYFEHRQKSPARVAHVAVVPNNTETDNFSVKNYTRTAPRTLTNEYRRAFNE